METTTKVNASPFDSILNFRDVGKTMNLLQGVVVLREGSFFRSAMLDNASQQDRETLLQTYRIKTIIDLRSKSEHLEQAKIHDAQLQGSTVHHQPKTTRPESPRIPEIQYQEINLNGRSYERALFKKLKFSSQVKLIALMGLGYRNEAISILGKEVMQPRGLIGLGQNSIESSGAELQQILKMFADKENYPILVHCKSGKDRTGLVTILLLLLLNVPLGAITQDYVKSKSELSSVHQSNVEQLRAMGMNEDFDDCPPGYVSEIKAYIDDQYGSLQIYLARIGVDDILQQQIKQNLLER